MQRRQGRLRGRGALGARLAGQPVELAAAGGARGGALRGGRTGHSGVPAAPADRRPRLPPPVCAEHKDMIAAGAGYAQLKLKMWADPRWVGGKHALVVVRTQAGCRGAAHRSNLHLHRAAASAPPALPALPPASPADPHFAGLTPSRSSGAASCTENTRRSCRRQACWSAAPRRRRRRRRAVRAPPRTRLSWTGCARSRPA